jgi:hypothetical protein
MYSSRLFRGVLTLLVVLASLFVSPRAHAGAAANRPALLALRMQDVVTNRARLVQASFIFVGIGVLLMCYKHK